jgi:predicted metal-dependent phosphotriesterase family hydrolase
MMRYFIREMLAHGISEEEIERMVKENPARLLGLL